MSPAFEAVPKTSYAHIHAECALKCFPKNFIRMHTCLECAVKCSRTNSRVALVYTQHAFLGIKHVSIVNLSIQTNMQINLKLGMADLMLSPH